MSKLRSSLLRKKAAAASDQTCINTWMDSGEEEKKRETNLGGPHIPRWSVFVGPQVINGPDTRSKLCRGWPLLISRRIDSSPSQGLLIRAMKATLFVIYFSFW